jgi:hypothetical protein
MAARGAGGSGEIAYTPDKALLVERIRAKPNRTRTSHVRQISNNMRVPAETHARIAEPTRLRERRHDWRHFRGRCCPLLPRLLAGRTRDPVFLASRRPVVPAVADASRCGKAELCL